MRALLLPTLLLLSSPAIADTASERQRGENLSLTLLAEDAALTPGGRHWLALRIEHDPHWHTYWLNPGDSGLPTRIRWTLPDGYAAGDIAWPYPSRIPIGPLVNFAYDGETWLLTPIDVPASAQAGGQASIAAEVSYLVCQEECIPGKQTLTLSLPIAERASPVDAHAEAFAAARAKLPVARTDVAGSVAEFGDALEISLRGPMPARFELFPATESVFANQAFAGWSERDGAVATRQAKSDSFTALPERLPMLLVDTAADPPRAYDIVVERTASPATAGAATNSVQGASAGGTVEPAGAAGMSIMLALLLAFAGGLILNLMPCVFPVLSMKALTLAQSAGDGARARREGVFYTLGVLASFAAIGGVLLMLRAGGEQVGWGFQLQSPWLIAALAYLMFLLGLNLSGAISVGAGWMNLGQRLTEGAGDRAAFFTGVLACVVAAPCTAPFMGAAIGYALTQPPPVALGVFLVLGLGLAAPLALFAFVPALARRLPRPGPWMDTFKQVLAFPMYLVAVWLLWVLARQTGADGVALALFGLVLLGFAAWLWERAKWRGARVPQAIAAAVFVLALAVLPLPQRFGAPVMAGAANAQAAWQPWTQDRLDELRAAGEPVLVNMTAAWCITCHANELVALSSDAFRERLDRHGIAYLKGDWTHNDDTITRYLARFDRAGVPLYVLYPRGDGAPVVLPQILTPGIVLDALDGAAGIAATSDPRPAIAGAVH